MQQGSLIAGGGVQLCARLQARRAAHKCTLLRAHTSRLQ